MKKLIKFIPLFLGIVMLCFSAYVKAITSGFRLFEINSSIGMLYISIYKYSALAGIVICSIYLIYFIRKLKHKNKSESGFKE
jgi:hypothetical protein